MGNNFFFTFTYIFFQETIILNMLLWLLSSFFRKLIRFTSRQSNYAIFFCLVNQKKIKYNYIENLSTRSHA